ncbi:SMI1/KNR4 family protein [Streptomyces coelicoflavus]|uniref:SMI1/KNR4 family protein n=1 Tax=Streptomyces coelicoflavus TaxID=285562 RepID=UPI000D58FD9B|nr:SMI1/KNR4 family protein [Streptomyces coelicoflavus]
MEFDEFEEHLSRASVRRASLVGSSDIEVFEGQIASESELSTAENTLGVELPEKYKQFMKRHGGGEFLFIDLLPIIASDSQEDDLLGVNSREFLSSGFIAVAPVGTGDWWGFSVVEGCCNDRVDFRDHEDGRVHSVASDFLDFLAHEGLRVGR